MPVSYYGEEYYSLNEIRNYLTEKKGRDLNWYGFKKLYQISESSYVRVSKTASGYRKCSLAYTKGTYLLKSDWVKDNIIVVTPEVQKLIDEL